MATPAVGLPRFKDLPEGRTSCISSLRKLGRPCMQTKKKEKGYFFHRVDIGCSVLNCFSNFPGKNKILQNLQFLIFSVKICNRQSTRLLYVLENPNPITRICVCFCILYFDGLIFKNERLPVFNVQGSPFFPGHGVKKIGFHFFIYFISIQHFLCRIILRFEKIYSH